MANEFAAQAGHSAEYFGDSRDHWWNDDFLRLALQRWGSPTIRNLLDVGCGVGHWGRVWARVLAADVEITGVDREPRWVEKARERSALAGLAGRCRYLNGSAEKLPFPDDTFDFVTCQTLLIHVTDAAAVLAEMVRVTRPGGWVVTAEPNNATAPVVEDALAVGLPAAEIASLVQFHLTCLRGKAALGSGDDCIGRVLPALFARTGLGTISVSLNDKAAPLVPPYATPRERALVEEVRDFADRDFWVWSRADSERYFLAGGGSVKEFLDAWELARALRVKLKEGLEAKSYTVAGGALFYLIAGRKPARS